MLAGVAGAGLLLVWEERGKPHRSLRLGWWERGLQPRRTSGQDSRGFATKSSVKAAEACRSPSLTLWALMRWGRPRTEACESLSEHLLLGSYVRCDI